MQNKNMVVLEEIVNAVDYAEESSVYNDGKNVTYAKGSKEFNDIVAIWKDMTAKSREMPAYGVSLNNETVKALNSGVWLEFGFNGSMQSNGMPFEKLLIQVESSFYGFNLIRYQSQYGYDGRCFYLDLNGNDMSNLYDYLTKL